jgi:effector-binding domain-containing protein
MWWIIAGIVAVGAVAAGPVSSDVEQAKYTVVTSAEPMELRDYAPMIVAEVRVSGTREEAINAGFKQIADYIFGNNIAKQEVAMTAPVIQQPSEKIAMTAPVIQQGEEGSWTVRFVMPAHYTMQTLPTPSNDAVKLTQVPAKRFAVVRFSGMATAEVLAQQTEALYDFIKQSELTPVAAPTYAFYNPPWTLPPLRRNEVMIEVRGNAARSNEAMLPPL